VCTGATPLFFLDYVAVGHVDPALVADVVAGVDAACVQVGCALLGGETAEHPGVMADDQLDLAGFAVGAVERDEQLGPDRVQVGDALVAIASGNLRSNGYSLARHVLFDLAGRSVADPAWEGAGRTLGDELMAPSVLFAPGVLAAVAAVPGAVHAAAHVTGGGIAANLARAMPDGAAAALDRSGIEVPTIFTEIQRLGGVADDEMARAFNLGVGMVLCVDAAGADAVVSSLRVSGLTASLAGEVRACEGVSVT
jgi:phosphoribosylformylglycinamidine cyclo-ligase